MTLSFLLVHSPLVGPSSLARLAEVAARRGHPVALPDLTPTVTADTPHDDYVASSVTAGAALPEPLVVVGHSGAGAYLPAISVDAGALTTVFVDAVVPPSSSPHRTPARLAELLDEQTVDGRLRPWLEWWDDETVTEILPGAADREALRVDLPRVPRSFYDGDVPVPLGWSERPCGYVQTSAAYDAELARCRALGWPTAVLDGTHLTVRTDPETVFDEIVRLVPENPR